MKTYEILTARSENIASSDQNTSKIPKISKYSKNIVGENVRARLRLHRQYCNFPVESGHDKEWRKPSNITKQVEEEGRVCLHVVN